MSKELEALEEIGNIDLGDNPYKTFDRNRLKNIYDKEFSTIKQALIKAQEQEKENARYKELEEQLGCPLDVRCKVVYNLIIYDEDGEQYSSNLIYDDNFVGYRLRPSSYGFLPLRQFKWGDYKKTWWFRKDKSE